MLVYTPAMAELRFCSNCSCLMQQHFVRREAAAGASATWAVVLQCDVCGDEQSTTSNVLYAYRSGSGSGSISTATAIKDENIRPQLPVPAQLLVSFPPLERYVPSTACPHCSKMAEVVSLRVKAEDPRRTLICTDCRQTRCV